MKTRTRLGTLSRRRFVGGTGSGAALLAASGLLPGWARTAAGLTRHAGSDERDVELELRIGRNDLLFGGKTGHAVTINGTVPGPMVRLHEGGNATLRVINELDEATSIHWRGILLPPEMDGVPGVSFAGIPAGETFVYHYPVKQSGTYWYHSHTGLQEQLGHYGPLIIDPLKPDAFEYDREHVVVLGDWTFENPYKVLAKLKKKSNYYNIWRRTVPGLFEEAGKMGGLGEAPGDRLAWGRMRMDATDIADITGTTYTYLMNGTAPDDNWTALYEPGEKVRLRFINAAAASFFDVRIPGLRMTVVQVDGQNVEPVPIDEFRIAIAETYDVIVEPENDRAYTIFAEAMDRSGYTRGTLATREGMSADVPDLRERPMRTMADMGMDHGAMGQDETSASEMEGSAMAMPAAAGHEGHGNARPMQHEGDDMAMGPSVSAGPIAHGPDDHGPGNAAVPMMVRSRLGDPGVGLGDDGRRVLLYSDLRALEPLYQYRPPDREIELHATGNMERYMWSFDGQKFSQVDGPIPFHFGERLRIHFVNDTMMEHPLHLHGMWMHIVNGNGPLNPRKHTVNVKPAERLAVDVEVDAPGRWAFHCHILYHMDAGMFRVVEVSEAPMEEGEHGMHRAEHETGSPTDSSRGDGQRQERCR